MATRPGHPRDCDCCAGTAARTPRRIANPPGQAAIDYRPARHGDVLASIIARLSSAEHPALAALGTREPSDLTVALADALASSLDVLGFYTERYANEHYLRTATERGSVQALARLIGYRPAPGVAASTHFAFTLRETPGAPATPITIPVGTRVQSVPGQDEKPQVFETVEAAPARAEWNALAVEQDRVRLPATGDLGLWLAGADARLAAGDRILLVSAPHELAPTAQHWAVRRLTRVAPDPLRGLTRVDWATPLGQDKAFAPGAGVRLFALRKRTAVFGHSAPDWRALSDAAKAGYIGLPGPEHLTRPADIEEWPDFSVLAPVYPERRSGTMGTIQIPVVATVDDIVLAATGSAQAVATKAMSNAANAAGGVVMAGGALADNAVAFAQEAFTGMSGVAKLAVDDVVQRTSTLIQGQAQALQALQGSAGVLVWDGAVESVRLAIAAHLSNLSSIVADLVEDGITDPLEVAKAVLDQLVEGLPDDVPDAIGESLAGAWNSGLDDAKAEIGVTQSQLDDSSDPLSLLVVVLAPVFAAQKALEAAGSKLVGLTPPSFGDKPAQLVQGVVDALGSAINDVDVGSALGELLNPAGGVDALQSAIAQLLSAGSGVGASLVELQSAIAGAAGAVFAKLGDETRAIAAQAHASVADTAELLNPANAVSALGESAAALHHHGRSAAAAALGASAAADVAGLVTLAVNIAKKQDILPIFDPPTPESIAAVARHFAAVGVTRAGGSVPAADVQGQAVALIDTIQGLLPVAAQSPLGAAEQLLPLIGDADELLNAPANAATEAYLAITTEIDRALLGNIVIKPGRRAPLVRAPDTIDISPAHDAAVAGSWALLSVPDFSALYRVADATVASRAEYLVTGQTTRLRLLGDLPGGRIPQPLEHAVRSLSVEVESEALELAREPLSYPVYGEALALAARAPDLQTGRPIALRGKRQRIAFAARVSDLVWNGDAGVTRILGEGDSLVMMAPPERLIGTTPAYLDPAAFGAVLGDESIRLRLTLGDRDGRVGQVELRASEIVFDAAHDDDPELAEIAWIATGGDAVRHERDRTHVQLAAPLRHCYARTSLRVNANVVAATHGETVEQMLGNGDGRAIDQRFALGQGPLTHVSAHTASGTASTLEVRVNDVVWGELPTLFDAAPAERAFETRVSDEGVTVIQFGDGVEGARLPSGSANVRARYRKGLGAPGNVAAGSLTTLLSRPLGVSEVLNPEPASGGDDPESIDQARDNAPLTVLTLGRAVSVSDYAHFARSFAGVAKAHALWVPAGPGRGLFLTIAGSAGAHVPPDGATFRNLADALHRLGDPLLPLRLANHVDTRFRCRLLIKVDDAYDSEPVLAAVDSTLRQRFGFAARRFGQPVSVDELAAAVHSVAGVVAVQVGRLYRAGEAETFVARLFARLPVASLVAAPQPAELLTLADDGIAMEVMP